MECAIAVNQCSFQKSVRVLKYRKQIESFLRKVEQNRGRYLVVCTGHQAEPGSVLSRIVEGEMPFRFRKGDNIIFSSSIIPTEVNIKGREKMDKKLRTLGTRLQIDVHVSGHGSREDLRDLIEILKPEHIIPAHGSQEQETPMMDLAKELGYERGKTSHLSTNGKVTKV
jgi:ribonuclease J